ncbi:MAG: ATP-grasp domain-containing protein [Acidobacteriia bacterium]|nr:ATP-grasp domain-containing protein [Terriglobia bacterium]
MLHTLPAGMAPGRAPEEFDLNAAAVGVAEAFPGAVVAGVRGEVNEVIQVVGTERPDVVWNLCEAPLGRPDREAHMAALLEWLGVPFTGCGSETLAICRWKDLTNAVLKSAGVGTPRAGVFPCIVKPADEDGSSLIERDCICEDAAAVERVRARISGPVVVQEFLPGREFAVAVWGRRQPDYVSIGETVFLNGLQLITYSAKWDTGGADYKDTPLYYNSEIAPELRAALAGAARAAWRAVGARGYIRVDIRLDSNGQPCVMDVNPNPEITPGTGMHWAAEEAGWSWERFVHAQLEWALDRQ